MLKIIGLFGGTFDPIHNGHIYSALELKQRLSLDELRLIPCHRPPHRDSVSGDAYHRLAMVKLATEAEPQLIADDREIKRDSLSYTVDTLEQLRAELGQQVSLCWIMGMDAFAGLESWHRWRELLTLAHLLIIARPGSALPRTSAVADWLNRYQCDDPKRLSQIPAGLIQVENLTPHSVSATSIREAIFAYYRRGDSTTPLQDDPFLQSALTPSVLNYINEHQLYREQTPALSKLKNQ